MVQEQRHITKTWDGGASAPPLRDERTFTPWAQPGWLAWDEWSPEVDFCRFVGIMQRMLNPAVILETGVGVGRITRFLDLGTCSYLGFESEAEWRQGPALPNRIEPTDEEMASADLVILDSDPAYRLFELAQWARCGKPGSTCISHDAGNGHPLGSNHWMIRQAIEATGIHGIFLANPRGGWVGQHP